MQRTLECSVCSDFYVPGTRPPKTLSCGHSFCSPCLHILYKDSTLTCPKCRTVCSLPGNKVDKLPTSYSILDMLDSVCGECHNQPHYGKCNHCDKNVCDPCREVHISASQSDSSAHYDELKTLVTQLQHKLADDRPLKDIMTRKNQALEKLTEIKDEQISLIEKQFNEKVSKVKAVAQEDIEQLLTHNGELRSLLTEANTLLDNIQKHHYLGAIKEDLRYKKEGDRLVKLLHNFKKTELPTRLFHSSLDKEEFMACLFKSFKLETKKSDGTNVVSQYQTVLDYTRYKCSDIYTDGLTGPMGVCVSPRSGDIIVTDHYTNKIHVFNDSLTPQTSTIVSERHYVGGVCGPYGLACDTDFVYIADSRNNRMYVSGVQWNLIRVFGTKGSGHDNFNNPNGVALDSKGHVYVCDRQNHRVKVTNKEGLYLRHFGKQIFSEEKPHFISVSPDNKVAVTDISGNLYLFTTSGQHIRTIKGKTPPCDIEANAVVFDSHGNIVVTDEGGRVVVMSETGEVRGVIGRPGEGRGELMYPRGLAFTTIGELVVCDYGNRRIQLFSEQ